MTRAHTACRWYWKMQQQSGSISGNDGRSATLRIAHFHNVSVGLMLFILLCVSG